MIIFIAILKFQSIQKFYFIDTTPPQINCPENVIMNTDPELYYATLNLSLPNGFGKFLIKLLL